MSTGQQYVQLKTELKDCVRDRNNLNTFTITTFVAVLGLAYKFALPDKPYFFLLAQIFMVPLLWRIVNYKKTEYMIANVIQINFGDPWEKGRSKSNAFYFEFFALSMFVTGFFLKEVIYNSATGSVGYAIASCVVSAVIFFLSYKSSKLAADNCDETWCELLFGCNNSEPLPTNPAATPTTNP